MDKINYSDEIKKRLSEMSPSEKESHIDMIEELIDFGQGYRISAEDHALYKALIEERANMTQASHDSINTIISSAEQKKGVQYSSEPVPAPER